MNTKQKRNYIYIFVILYAILILLFFTSCEKENTNSYLIQKYDTIVNSGDSLYIVLDSTKNYDYFIELRDSCIVYKINTDHGGKGKVNIGVLNKYGNHKGFEEGRVGFTFDSCFNNPIRVTIKYIL